MRPDTRNHSNNPKKWTQRTAKSPRNHMPKLQTQQMTCLVWMHFVSFEPFRTSNRPERRSPSSERPQVTFRTVLAGALLAFPCFGKHTRRPSEHEASPVRRVGRGSLPSCAASRGLCELRAARERREAPSPVGETDGFAPAARPLSAFTRSGAMTSNVPTKDL